MSTSDDSHFDPDDPRLTAYALGELPDPAERAHVEALLAASPEARAELADIRAFTAALTAEYEQERLAADSTPANVICLPDRRRSPARPLFAVAAALLAAGLLAALLLPVTNRVPVRGTRRPHEKSAALASTAQTADKDQEAPAPAPTSPLLAATTLAAPPMVLSRSQPLKLDAPTSAPGSASPYTDATSINGETLLAESSKSFAAMPEAAGAARGAGTGSTIPTSDEIADAPAVSLPAESQAMAPRKVLRAASVTTSGRITGTPVPALSKRPFTGFLSPETASTNRVPPFDAVGGVVVAAKPLAMADDRDRLVAQVDTAKNPDLLTAAIDVPKNEIVTRKTTARLIPRGDAFNTAAYDHVAETPFLAAKENPLSTFSLDVDTASYAIVRRFIEQGSLPPPDAVRIGEMLNYFPYDDAPPAPGDERLFAIDLEGAACPWNPDHRLVRVALNDRKTLVKEMSGPLDAAAKDVKIQVEFNPATVAAYRLIGDEKRLLRKEDFNGDRVNAGEIGAGHGVTALYEVVPAGQPESGGAPGGTPPADARELLTVKVRHKVPEGDKSERSDEAAFVDHGAPADYANASPDFKFAAAVASFGLALRDSPYKGNATLGAAVELAEQGKGSDAAGTRAGFIELARRAQSLHSSPR